ncbi:MAG: molecular chaperone TorD family protein [Coriobacteriales bacterium]|jgi:TorA maturation chaperone TorD|nr:molecular chaperone TorD family protein [Coriobacteriales bacterium]
MMTTDELAYQANTYRLVAQLLRYPTPDLKQGIQEARSLFFENSEEFRMLYLMDQCVLAKDADMLNLEIDYAALFIGSLTMLAPPYASYYLDGNYQLGGPSTVAIEREYRRCGLALKSDRKQPGDHLATMLEFLFDLLRQVVIRNKRSLENEARVFFQTYLQDWICDFCDLIKVHAQTRFYAVLSEFLPLVLLSDSLLLDNEEAAETYCY